MIPADVVAACARFLTVRKNIYAASFIVGLDMQLLVSRKSEVATPKWYGAINSKAAKSSVPPKTRKRVCTQRISK